MRSYLLNPPTGEAATGRLLGSRPTKASRWPAALASVLRRVHDDQHPPDDHPGAGRHPRRPQRAPANRARDRYRHPKETLLFFGHPAGNGGARGLAGAGLVHRVIAPLLRDQG